MNTEEQLRLCNKILNSEIPALYPNVEGQIIFTVNPDGIVGVHDMSRHNQLRQLAGILEQGNYNPGQISFMMDGRALDNGQSLEAQGVRSKVVVLKTVVRDTPDVLPEFMIRLIISGENRDMNVNVQGETTIGSIKDFLHRPDAKIIGRGRELRNDETMNLIGATRYNAMSLTVIYPIASNLFPVRVIHGGNSHEVMVAPRTTLDELKQTMDMPNARVIVAGRVVTNNSTTVTELGANRHNNLAFTFV